MLCRRSVQRFCRRLQATVATKETTAHAKQQTLKDHDAPVLATPTTLLEEQSEPVKIPGNIQPHSIHAKPLVLPSTEISDHQHNLSDKSHLSRLYWIPPSQKVNQQTHELPPPPKYNFNSFVPEDVVAERQFMEAVGRALPPNDVFQIPVALSRPWFTWALRGYCIALAFVVAAMGNWDALNEGQPHCFSAYQQWLRNIRNQLWSVAPEIEQEEIRKRFKI